MVKHLLIGAGIGASVAALSGCASAQKLSVQTTPVGAEVFLQRRGELEVEATVAGVQGNVRAGSFEEDYFSLGNAPVEYEFELEERPLPTDEDVAKVVAERVTALLEADLRGRRSSVRERMQRFIPLAKKLGELEDDDVMAMLLDDYYHKSLHEPQYPSAAEAEAPPPPKKREGGKPRRGRGGRGRRRR